MKKITPMYKSKRNPTHGKTAPTTLVINQPFEKTILAQTKTADIVIVDEGIQAPAEITEVKEPTLAERVQSLIDHARGAEEYIKTNRVCKWIFHTDSINHVCEAAGAFWFLDVIVSWLPKLIRKHGHGADFQVWQMKVNRRKSDNSIIDVRIWCEDGNDNKLMAQIIPFTDFPLDEFKVYVERGSLDGKNACYIIMLPGDR